MNDLLTAASEVQEFCRAEGWKFCLIGGLAVVRWGRPRTTRDVDISLLTEWGDEERYIDRLLERFAGRVGESKEFALRARVLLIKASNGTPIDIALASIAFERDVIERATYFDYADGCTLLTASADDLIILKAFADRPQDWVDIEGLIARNSEKLDRRRIIEDLTPLCELKDSPDIVPRLSRMLAANP